MIFLHTIGLGRRYLYRVVADLRELSSGLSGEGYRLHPDALREVGGVAEVLRISGGRDKKRGITGLRETVESLSDYVLAVDVVEISRRKSESAGQRDRRESPISANLRNLQKNNP